MYLHVPFHVVLFAEMQKRQQKEKERKEKQFQGAVDLPAATCAKELRAANMSACAM
jgi:hypothetical protein